MHAIETLNAAREALYCGDKSTREQIRIGGECSLAAARLSFALGEACPEMTLGITE
jgi:hypothetical protein